jgi:hypothetical protein
VRFRVTVTETREAALVVEASTADHAVGQARELQSRAGDWLPVIVDGVFTVKMEQLRAAETDPQAPLTNGCRHCGRGLEEDLEPGWNGWCAGCTARAEALVTTECPDCHHAHTEDCIDAESCVACATPIDLFRDDGQPLYLDEEGVLRTATGDGANCGICGRAFAETAKEGPTAGDPRCVNCGGIRLPRGGVEDLIR